MTILQIYCVQRIGPANPIGPFTISKQLYITLIKSLVMLKMRFLNHKCSYAIGRQMYQ